MRSQASAWWIAVTDQASDKLVYELYELSDEEIATVEAATEQD